MKEGYVARVRSGNSGDIRSRWSPIKEEFQDYDPVSYVASM